MNKKGAFFFVFVILLNQSFSQLILPLRDQATITNEILNDRLTNLLPKLMEREHIDMWVIISREYNEDPILKTMLPAEWLSARRRTILVFYHDSTKKVNEQLAIARYNVGNQIKASWDMKKFPDQWDALIDIINTRNPNKIALNYSTDFAHADGLTFTEQKIFIQNNIYVLVLHTSFKLAEAKVEGTLLIALGINSLSMILSKIDQILGELDG